VALHHNHGLFADYFLGDSAPGRVADLSDWHSVTDVRQAFQAIAELYRRAERRLRAGSNEPQTEEHCIRPILRVLWGEECYEVQEGIPQLGVSQRRPDYAFFAGPGDRDTAHANGGEGFWRKVPCLGDAKAWMADLDRARGAGENPSAQVSDYLYRSRVRWGILTNGTHWRLYEQDRSRAGGIFYEANLQELIQQGDPERFKYFYLFFRREAFAPGPTGACFVEQVLQRSAHYAAGIGDSLKESVYDALGHLMNGFLENSANTLNARDPATLKAVHDNCLILLYRLLFILYAEDRKLLDRDDLAYSRLGLCAVQGEINERLRGGEGYQPVTRRLWNHLGVVRFGHCVS